MYSYLIIVFPAPVGKEYVKSFFENEKLPELFQTTWEFWEKAEYKDMMQKEWMKSTGTLDGSAYFMVVSELMETNERTVAYQGFTTSRFENNFTTAIVKLNISKMKAQEAILSKENLVSHIETLYFSPNHPQVNPTNLNENALALFTKVVIKNKDEINKPLTPKTPLLLAVNKSRQPNRNFLEPYTENFSSPLLLTLESSNKKSSHCDKVEELIRDHIINTFSPCLRKSGFFGLFQGIKPYDRPARIIIKAAKNKQLTNAQLRKTLDDVLNDIKERNYGRNFFLIKLEDFLQAVTQLESVQEAYNSMD